MANLRFTSGLLAASVPAHIRPTSLPLIPKLRGLNPDYIIISYNYQLHLNAVAQFSGKVSRLS